MTKDEALKLGIESLEWHNQHMHRKISEQAIAAMKEALMSGTDGAQPENCEYCDGTGDVHSIDGEWRGVCICEAGKALAQPEQEHVAWLITDEKINSLQVGSIQRLIDRARHAHMTDIKLRINGQDEWYEADWLKHLTRTTPPPVTESHKRKPLTDEEIEDIWADCPADWDDKINVLTLARAIEAAHGIKELKEYKK